MSDDANEPAPPTPSPLVAFDPRWRRRFEDEKGRLLVRLGPKLVTVEHVGATAVTGLSARPIVDLLVAVRSDDAPAVSSVLATLGYAAAAVRGDDGLQAHERDSAGGRYRLLLCARTMKSYGRILLFREWLRANPLGVLRYEKLRQDAVTAGDDAYYAAKDRFIAGAVDHVIDRAQ